MTPRKGREIRPGMWRQRAQTVLKVTIEADKTTVEWDDGTTEVLTGTQAIEVEDG